MSFQYSRAKKQTEEGGSQWTSYSDLFLGLSVVFLLLYVTASLRSGTTGLQQQVEREKLVQQVQDLKNQLKAYNTIRQDYLDDSSVEENKMYQGLLDKLSLLKEDAKTEKERLKQAALENENKENALNQYQKLVRNMINSNVLAAAKIKRKDLVIGQKNQELKDSKQTIEQLEDQVSAQQNELTENEKMIAQVKSQFVHKTQELKAAYQAQHMTKKAYENKMNEIKEAKNNELKELEEKNEGYKAQLRKTTEELSGLSSELESAKGALTKVETQKQDLVQKLEANKGQYETQLAELNKNFEEQKAKGDSKAQAMAEKIVQLKEKMATTQNHLNRALEEANARKNIAAEIKKSFAKAGVKADVNSETGDVIINFGDQYFDSGKSNLKDGMVQILRKAFPLYATSLYENPKAKVKISAIEIIGYASPTYKGKLVDPDFLNQDERKAVDFNLDLSYNRARSIFQYLFDKNKMTFKYQEEILPLVKVSGRSFLSEVKSLRRLANQNKHDFCAQQDCKKAQKVIVRFELGN
ncbi:MAG: microtubule-binding protein [Bdellovibrionales bacterium]|nr:microtubule-binding protein [Bdellovibrionales bacterium]